MSYKLTTNHQAEIRGCPKSKAELAEIEKERLIAERGKREAALSKSLLDDATAAGSNHKGLRMMKMMGFKPGSALGKQRSPLPESSSGDSPGGGNKNWIPTEARLEPIGVVVKEDRGGIGHVTAQRAKVKAAFGDVKKQEMTPDEYRQRVAEEREEKLKESQFYAAQKVCEGFDTERDHPGEAAKGKDLVGKERTVPLKNINVLWRGLVKHREGKEKERRMRYDLMQSLDQPRLPGYDRNHELDTEDKVALGIGLPSLGRAAGMTYVEDGGDEEQEEDEELEAFEALSFAGRLQRVVGYLRKEYHYCFWCKYKYEDEDMDGCPGSDEDLHG